MEYNPAAGLPPASIVPVVTHNSEQDSFVSVMEQEFYEMEKNRRRRRRFDLAQSPHHDVPERHLFDYDPDKHISHLQVCHPRRLGICVPQEHTLVIWIDGGCQGAGTPAARASWSVYLGPDSRYNMAKPVDRHPEVPQTALSAKIVALNAAITIARLLADRLLELSEVRIVTHSRQLFLALTEWMAGWMRQGGKTRAGQPVQYLEMLREVDMKLDDLASGADGDRGLDVKLWLVGRGKCNEAAILAMEALGPSRGGPSIKKEETPER